MAAYADQLVESTVEATAGCGDRAPAELHLHVLGAGRPVREADGRWRFAHVQAAPAQAPVALSCAPPP